MITTENTRIPEWVQKGKMRWVWGLWEPLMFYRRNASQNATAVGNALWSEAYYRRMHSEEIVAQLAEAGVNCISTHYFKGFGLKAEAHEMDLAAELTERYHKYGIRVFGYHQYGTLAYETLKEEVPDLEDWAMRNEDGSIYCYGADRHTGRGGLYWRWMACSTSDAHADYLKRVIRKCLTGAGMDGIEWDGTVYRCYCERCQQRFKAYLQEAIILRLGGVGLYRQAIPFFVGLTVGQAAGVALSITVDMIWFPGNGHYVHGW